MRSGRKPAGPKLVEGIEGSEYAKKRLEEVLRTLSGEKTIEEACAELNIGRTRFYDLRQKLLEEMVERLEPRPAGRPPVAPEKSDKEVELERENERLKVELAAAKARAELNTFLPYLRPPPKKTKG